jgi:hypothetical protein
VNPGTRLVQPGTRLVQPGDIPFVRPGAGLVHGRTGLVRPGTGFVTCIGGLATGFVITICALLIERSAAAATIVKTVAFLFISDWG